MLLDLRGGVARRLQQGMSRVLFVGFCCIAFFCSCLGVSAESGNASVIRSGVIDIGSEVLGHVDPMALLVVPGTGAGIDPATAAVLFRPVVGSRGVDCAGVRGLRIHYVDSVTRTVVLFGDGKQSFILLIEDRDEDGEVRYVGLVSDARRSACLGVALQPRLQEDVLQGIFGRYIWMQTRHEAPGIDSLRVSFRIFEEYMYGVRCTKEAFLEEMRPFIMRADGVILGQGVRGVALFLEDALKRRSPLTRDEIEMWAERFFRLPLINVRRIVGDGQVDTLTGFKKWGGRMYDAVVEDGFKIDCRAGPKWDVMRARGDDGAVVVQYAFWALKDWGSLVAPDVVEVIATFEMAEDDRENGLYSCISVSVDNIE